MIVAVVAAATLIPPSREALIERWLHANPRHRVEWLASPPARPAPKTIDLRALAQRELSIDGRYNLTTAQAKAPEPLWRQALKWIADWWNNLWRSIAKRAHIAPRTANDLGYVVLALVGLTLLVVGVRLARNIRLSRSERGAQGEPLAASPDPQALYQTFATQLARLPEETRVFPGHEYLARNLEFTLDREPDNRDAPPLLEEARRHDPAAATVTTLGREKRINAFFRLQNPGVIARLREKFPEIGEHPDARTVFVKLRELRNRW